MNVPRTIPSRTVVTSFSSVTNKTAIESTDAYEEGHYVLHVACGPSSSGGMSTNNTKSPLSCALSNQCVQTYDRETLKKVHTIEQAHHKPIADMSHAGVGGGNSIESPLLVTSSLDGLVKIFDLRMSASGSNSTHPAVQLGLPQKGDEALSVSIGYGGALAAVGGSKSNIHFFDLRQISSQSVPTSPLGSYVDAHSGEVTKVRFQKLNQESHDTTSLIVSASEDGLACIHDTSQPSEEMALKSVINVQSPLRDVGFFGPSREGIYCLTGSETMSIWHHDSAQRICDFGDVRNHLSATAGLPIHYLVGCNWDERLSQLNLLAGNTEGQSVIYQVDAGSIFPKRILSGGHKACIRGFISSPSGSIVTAGEDSRMCEWDMNINQVNNGNQQETKGKTTSSTLSSRSPPRSGGGVIRRQKKKKSYAPY